MQSGNISYKGTVTGVGVHPQEEQALEVFQGDPEGHIAGGDSKTEAPLGDPDQLLLQVNIQLLAYGVTFEH